MWEMEGPEWPRCPPLAGEHLHTGHMAQPVPRTWCYLAFQQLQTAPHVWFTLCQNPWNFWIWAGRICDPFTTQTVNPVWSEPSAAMWWKKRAGRNFTACFLLQRDTDGLTEIWKDLQMQLLLQWASWSMGRSAGGAELWWWHLHCEVAQTRRAYILSPDKL